MPSSVSRRNFLIASLAVPLAATAAPALAVESTDQFTAAATKYQVPVAVLAAVSYGQTRWEDHSGRPSTSGGYGPMHLIDGAAVAAVRANRTGKPNSAPVIDTLAQAAELSGYSPSALKNDPAANIMGAAAILASTQKSLGHPLGAGTDPASWYEAIASVSGLTSASAQQTFADGVLADLQSGAVKATAGGTLRMQARAVGSPGAQRQVLSQRVAAAKAQRPRGPVDAPAGLDVEWTPAPYEQYGPNPWDYGNHDLGFRPKSPALNQIVIHDMDGYYDGSITLVKDPTYLAWNYSIRSADGHIAQHLETKDIGWHAGNWYINGHALGIEHEGFAADGSWYTEVMYRNSAKLVKYLARKYDIPLDRSHILGHDQVPATTAAGIPSMHWDPGPFWDWEHYFTLLGANLRKGTSTVRPKSGQVVRILPGFDGNFQPLTGYQNSSSTPYPDLPTNFVTLRTQPDWGAPVYTDKGLHQNGTPGSTYVSDMGARAAAGCDYVVAEVIGDWTAIWFLGDKVWFYNPRKNPTVRVLLGAKVVTPKAGKTTIPVYGRALPEPSAYTDPADVVAWAPLTYQLASAQSYALVDEKPPTDYYKANTYDIDTPGDHVDIIGKTKYYMISVGHRIGFVLADDVQASRAW